MRESLLVTIILLKKWALPTPQNPHLAQSIYLANPDGNPLLLAEHPAALLVYATPIQKNFPFAQNLGERSAFSALFNRHRPAQRRFPP